jgi:exonuclease SbcC
MSNSEESTESPAVTATTQQQSTRQETPPPTATGGYPPADRAAPQPPSVAEQSEPTAAETDQPAERTEANAADETPPAALDPAPEENATPAAGSTTTPLAGEDKTPPADDTPALSAEQIAAISERTRERIEKLTLAIENGQLSEAQSLCDRSQNALNKLAKANIQSELEQQLAPLKAELTELLDWKRFADTEKKKALVEQMTALIDNDQAPPARAKKVKALQEEWRGLGHAEDNDRLWAEFSDAARKAFEPCKQYFRERKQLMRENLTQRTRICESLEAYAASIENTDINLAEVNQQESEARKQWKQYAPVAQNKIKQLQARFNEVLSGLRRQRRQALQENARRKLLLIEEAK